MSKTWQTILYGAAAVCFFLGFVGAEVNHLSRRGPLRWWTARFIALGLLFWVLVPLVTLLNAP